MAKQREEWINRRAYAIWEEKGRPDGDGHENWLQASAERDRLESSRASLDGSDVMARNAAMRASSVVAEA